MFSPVKQNNNVRMGTNKKIHIIYGTRKIKQTHKCTSPHTKT